MPEDITNSAQTTIAGQEGGNPAQEPSIAEDGKQATEPQATPQEGNEDNKSQEGGEGAKEGEQTPAQEPKKVQSQEENAEFARKRREQETQAKIDKAKEEARVKAIIDIIGENPYTKEPLENESDVKIYEAMKEYEKNGGDPIADQAKIIKRVMRQETDSYKQSIEQQKAKQDADAKAKSEVEEFTKAYPNVDLGAVLKDADFNDYAEGKIGKKSLKEIYDGYNRLKGIAVQAQKQAQEQQEQAQAQAQQQANARAGVGSLQGEPSNPKGYITPEQFSRMSAKERVDKYDEIKKSMPYWR